MRVITWNVDGLQKMLARRQEPLHSVLKQLSAGEWSIYTALFCCQKWCLDMAFPKQTPCKKLLRPLKSASRWMCAADVVCIQETQLTKKDKGNLLDLASVPGW